MSPQATRTFSLLAVLAVFGCSRSAPESPNAVATFSGDFADKGGQQTTGSFRVERVGDDIQLVLSGDFATDEGPDLHVVLTSTSVDAATNDNVLLDDSEVVGLLKALSGPQTYRLTDDLDLSRFRTVAIHCIRFSHLYGAAPLERSRESTAN